MKIKNLFVIHSIVALVNGGGNLLFPKLYLSLYGITVTNPADIFIAQLLGAGLLTYCFVAWFARDAENSTARRAIVLSFFLTLAIGFVIALMAQLSGVMNVLGWMVVGLYLVLAGAYGYFYFMKPDAA